MIKVIRKFFTGLLLLSLTAASYAQEDAGVEAIWRIGFGSRAMGMGRAFTAISNDNAALYYNPAGLDEIQQKSISLFYTNLVLDANYSFMSFTYPTLHTGTFGVAIGRIGSGSYGIRTDSPVDIISDAYYDQYRIYLGYGKEILEYLSVGANLKADYHTAITSEGLDGTKDLSSFSFGADIGVLYKGNDLPVVGNLRAGLNLINVLKPQNKLFQETDELPLTLRFGLAKPVPLSNENLLNIAVDLAKAMESEAPFHYNIGVEFRYHQIASVRAGFDEGTIAAGLGIMWKGVRFDYAYGNLSTESAFDAQHRFTLTYSFGSTKQEEMTLEKLSLEQRDSVMVEEAISVEKQNQIEKSFKAGMDYMEKNKWFNATVEFQQILSIDPFNREARKMFKQADSLLQLEYQKEQQALAEKQTSEAIAKQDREYIDYHYNKGREYLKKNQFTEALLEFNAALERDPKNKTLLEARDTAQRRLDNAVNQLITKGRAEYRKGNFPEALRLLSEAKVMLSEDNALITEIDQLSRRIQVQGDLSQGLKAMESGDYKKAARIFKAALQTDPGNADVRRYLKRAEGRANARKVVLAPSDEKAYQQGVDKFLSGNFEAALAIWNKLLDKYPYSLKLINAVETAELRLRRTKSGVLEK